MDDVPRLDYETARSFCRELMMEGRSIRWSQYEPYEAFEACLEGKSAKRAAELMAMADQLVGDRISGATT